MGVWKIPLILLALLFFIPQVFAEELKILESQLNENSITGILQNQYDYPASAIIVRAEFYDKEDGHLVGVRDFGLSSIDPLGPNEKSSYKIPEFAGDKDKFPKTDFIVKAEGFLEKDEIQEGNASTSLDNLLDRLDNITAKYKNIEKAANAAAAAQDLLHNNTLNGTK
jgi:hypothetical protein